MSSLEAMKIYLANFDKLSAPVNEEVLKYIKRLSGVVEVVRFKNVAAFSRFSADKLVVVLAEEGKLFSTQKLSEWINARLSKNMVFVVGPAYGMEAQAKQNAGLLLSLSPLTFSHEHAFLLLTEQIYRCLMVIKGHPYHHI